MEVTSKTGQAANF